ncbi:MAG: hypothetical protein Q8T13_04910 [Acidobacteriota bacterium]|nr:hypothetical protein [Acidobacteriota bacterium]
MSIRNGAKRAAGQVATFTKGAGYVATVRLSTKDNQTLASPGDPCGQVPDSSLPHLVAHDPPQIVAAKTWNALSAPQAGWLIDRAGRNQPIATATDLDVITRTWLAKSGFSVPEPETGV